MSEASKTTRRTLLTGIGGAAGLGLLSTAGALSDVLPGGAWLRRHLRMTGSDGAIPHAEPGQVSFLARHSVARNSRVECLVARPAGAPPGPLPVWLALHPKGSSARGMVELGLPQFLTDAVASGTPPCVLVAPDGGTHYWHDDGAGDDPMRMLEEELPGWLAEIGLDAPSAVLGISMGGFGALSYSRRCRRPVRTAALSPALFDTWEAADGLDAFPVRSVWEANGPLRHAAELDGRRLGVWCGTADVYYETARELAERTRPAVASFTAGDHTDGYWWRVLPEIMRFLGRR